MKLGFLLLLLPVIGVAQPTIPIFTNVGPLSCGLRLYSPGQLQKYCLYNNPPNPIATLCNGIHQVFPANQSMPRVSVAGDESCFVTDSVAGQSYRVTWLVYAARPPSTNGFVHYQIAITTQPCTFNPGTGICMDNPGMGTTTSREGNIDSGLSNVVVGTLWYGAAAPGMALSVLYTDDFAEAVGNEKTCRVTSAEPGIATFATADADGTLQATWLRDGWCPGGLGDAPYIVGNCYYTAVTENVQAGTSAPLFKTQARCTATPVQALRTLMQVHLQSFSQLYPQ